MLHIIRKTKCLMILQIKMIYCTKIECLLPINYTMRYRNYKRQNTDLDALLVYACMQSLNKNIIKRIVFHPDCTEEKLKSLNTQVQNEINVYIHKRGYKCYDKKLENFFRDFDVEYIIKTSFNHEHYATQVYCVDYLAKRQDERIFNLLNYEDACSKRILIYMIITINIHFPEVDKKIVTLCQIANLEKGLQFMVDSGSYNLKNFCRFGECNISANLRDLMKNCVFFKPNCQCHRQLSQCDIAGSWNGWVMSSRGDIVIKLEKNKKYWFKFHHSKLGWHIHNEYIIDLASSPAINCITY